MRNTHIPKKLDRIFEALANEHRRDIIYAIGLHPYSITELALLRGLSLPAIHKHIKILKEADIIISRKIGRTQFISLNRLSIRTLQQWLFQYYAYWGNNSETLENYAEYIQKNR
jgi:DNA-binding transcriptional ArsR family regulator